MDKIQMAIDWVGLNFTQKKMGKEIMWGSEGDFYTTEEIVEQYLLTQIKKTTDELISELQERSEIAEDELDKLKQSDKQVISNEEITNAEKVNQLAIEMLAVLHKVVHAIQNSNMKGTILHSEITAVVKKAMLSPIKIKR